MAAVTREMDLLFARVPEYVGSTARAPWTTDPRGAGVFHTKADGSIVLIRPSDGANPRFFSTFASFFQACAADIPPPAANKYHLAPLKGVSLTRADGTEVTVFDIVASYEKAHTTDAYRDGVSHFAEPDQIQAQIDDLRAAAPIREAIRAGRVLPVIGKNSARWNVVFIYRVWRFVADLIADGRVVYGNMTYSVETFAQFVASEIAHARVPQDPSRQAGDLQYMEVMRRPCDIPPVMGRELSYVFYRHPASDVLTPFVNVVSTTRPFVNVAVDAFASVNRNVTFTALDAAVSCLTALWSPDVDEIAASRPISLESFSETFFAVARAAAGGGLNPSLQADAAGSAAAAGGAEGAFSEEHRAEMRARDVRREQIREMMYTAWAHAVTFADFRTRFSRMLCRSAGVGRVVV